MSSSRTALVLALFGLLSLTACSVGEVTASSSHLPSTPTGGAGPNVAGNTPWSGERPHATDRASSGAHAATHASEARSFGFGCHHCSH